MKVHVEIVISGLVQMVGYRYFAIRKANEHNVFGYVKNLLNGDVYCEAEGEEGLINDFISELRIGPRSSQVTSFHVNKDEKLSGYTSFEVRF